MDLVTRGGRLHVPLAALADHQARFYSYRPADGAPLRFFALLASDGEQRAALDSCVVCYGEGKGYAQRGDELICRHCGERFPSAQLSGGAKPCRPVALNFRIQGEQLVIDGREAEAIARRLTPMRHGADMHHH